MSTDLQQAIAEYASHLTAERNLAPRTIEAYRYDLERLAVWLVENGASRCDVMDDYHLKDYLARLQEDSSLKPTTMARTISSIRGLFAFLMDRGQISSNPALKLRIPKKAQRLPIYLTQSEAGELLSHREEENPLSPRNRAMLLTLVMTGLRVSELVGLDVGDVDFERRNLRVLGKGRKERLVPLNSSVQAALRGWIGERASPTDGSTALFLDRHGARVTPRMVQYAVRKAVKAMGLDPRISPHKLRHTFATNLYAEEVDLRDIQDLLGHKNIASTSVYTHTNVDRVRAAVEKLTVEE